MTVLTKLLKNKLGCLCITDFKCKLSTRIQVNTTMDRHVVEEMDRKGQLRRNLHHPPRKDTVMVPDGGYTIIRFRANNPGTRTRVVNV